MVVASDLSIDAVVNIKFNYTHSHCLEMTVPVCAACAMNPVCQHRIGFFQSVFRTTNFLNLYE